MIPNNKRIRVGVVGAGQIVRDFHLASLHAIPGISIDWICDIVAERAAELAAAFRIPRYYGSIQACPAVDMVLITTPVGVRKAVLDVAVSRGWHAYCEKPFARNANEHREMIDFARRQGVRLGAGYMRRQYYSTRTLQAVLNNEWLGSIQRVIAADCDRVRKTGRSEWFMANPALSGGGFLQEFGSHLADQIFMILGATNFSVTAQAQVRLRDIEYRTAATGVITAANGSFVPFSFLTSRLEQMYTGITVECARGSVAMDLTPESNVVISQGGEQFVLPCPLGPKDAVTRAYRDALEQFVVHIQRNETSFADAETGLLASIFMDECSRKKGDMVAQ